jgi:mannosyltransferase OCH1-like enzyme
MATLVAGALVAIASARIPLQLHQVWYGADRAPMHRYNFSRQWLQSGFESIVLHDDADALFGGAFGDAHPAWRMAYEHFVQYARAHADIARCSAGVIADFMKYVVLYRYGGFVADFDVEPVEHASRWAHLNAPLDDDDGARCTLYLGAEIDHTNKGATSIGCQICNWILGAESGDHFLHEIIDDAAERMLAAGDAFTCAIVQQVAGSVPLTERVEYIFAQRGVDYRQACVEHLRFLILGAPLFRIDEEVDDDAHERRICVAPFPTLRGQDRTDLRPGAAIYTVHHYQGSWRQT